MARLDVANKEVVKLIFGRCGLEGHAEITIALEIAFVRTTGHEFVEHNAHGRAGLAGRTIGPIKVVAIAAKPLRRQVFVSGSRRAIGWVNHQIALLAICEVAAVA